MSDQTTRILLIRHGINDFVAQRRLAGRGMGVHLNTLGQAQVASLADRLAGSPIVAVYASPLERAVETATPLAARLGLRVEVHEGLLETDCGEWTGQPMDELAATDAWRVLQSSPSLFRFPGGERFARTQERMVSTLEALREARGGSTFAVVSHSDPIRLAVAFYVGIALDHFQRLVIDPASISELDFTAERPRLMRLNDCAHLAFLRVPDTMQVQ